MKTTIEKLARVLSRTTKDAEAVHFHGGAAGPYVCENPHCTSPALSASEVT